MDKRQEEPPSGQAGPIVIAYNRDFLPGGSAANAIGCEAGEESADVAGMFQACLVEAGYDVVTMSVDDDPETLVEDIVQAGAERVVNLVESLGGDGGREHEVPALLEVAGVRYTGNGPRPLLAAQAKNVTRTLLERRGVPVAPGLVVDGPEHARRAAAALRFPLFVKPACVDGSVGVDQGSLVRDVAALEERLGWLAERIPGPYLVEGYLPGREINVAICPNPMTGFFAITEIDFTGYPADYAPIVTYDCKWTPDCPESTAFSKAATPETLGPELYRAVIQVARRAFEAIRGTSYGRVDMRLDERGRPCVIDINPNPDLHPDAGFSLAAKSRGVSWEQLAQMLLDDACLKERRLGVPGRLVAGREDLRWVQV